MKDEITAVEITERAYQIYEARGAEHGNDMNDWLKAEKEISMKNTKEKTVLSTRTKRKK